MVLAFLLALYGCITAQPIIYPGMSISDFRALLPGQIPEHLRFYGTYEKDTIINNVKGKWIYDFKSDVLKSAEFHSLIHIVPLQSENNPEKFLETYNTALDETNQLIKFYKEKYGKPDKYTKTDFTTDNFTGRMLVNCIWEFKNLKIQISLNFYGLPENNQYVTNSALITYKFQSKIVFLENYNSKADLANENVVPGITLENFAKIYPELFPKGILESGQSNFRNKLYNLDGYWYYRFKNDTLDNYGYYYSINNSNLLNEGNFRKCLSSTKAIIQEYTGYFGTPDSLFEGQQTFIDPSIKKHWGYKVIEAYWIENNQKIKVGFDFNGGKGQYFFNVYVKYFRKEYPYFD
ncbi:MAG: hypothetical protein Kow0068_16100 [Marinilabiliales bacterium]